MDIFILPVLQIRKLGIRQVSCLPRGTQWSVSTQLGCFPKFLFLMAILIGTDFFFFFFLPVLEAEKSKVKEQADSALGDL